ncbi:MAG: PaaI family thioesterase [Candidatus Melainabacteria bacterium]|nr:PaaI family thioesterase [Candidatus Melainabacteria bacterium]
MINLLSTVFTDLQQRLLQNNSVKPPDTTVSAENSRPVFEALSRSLDDASEEVYEHNFSEQLIEPGSKKRGQGLFYAETKVDNNMLNGFTHNQQKTTHGGVYQTLLDTAMAGAAQTIADEDQRVVTSTMHTQFLKPSYKEDKLYTVAHVVNRDERGPVTCDGYVVNDKLEIISKATGQFIRRPAEKQGVPTRVAA